MAVPQELPQTGRFLLHESLDRGVASAEQRCDGGWGWWADGIVETKVAAAGMAAMCGVKRVAVLESWP